MTPTTTPPTVADLGPTGERYYWFRAAGRAWRPVLAVTASPARVLVESIGAALREDAVPGEWLPLDPPPDVTS